MVNRLKRRNFTHKSAGLTLLEVIFAIGIMAMIFSLCIGAVSLTANISQRINQQTEVSAKARYILDKLTLELTSIQGSNNGSTGSSNSNNLSLVPFPGDRTNGSGSNIYVLAKPKKFNGNQQDSITFLSRDTGTYLPGRNNFSGVVQIRYSLVEDDSKKRSSSSERSFVLLREEIPATDLANRAQAYEKIIRFPFAKDIEGFGVRLLRKSDRRWVNEWGIRNNSRKRDPLPQMIELTLTLKNDRGNVSNFTTLVSIKE